MTRSDRPHLRPLTGLRFVAAFHVLLYHAALTSAPAGPLHNLIYAGFVGVGLFFTLSGFILVYTYFDAPATARLNVRSFLGARVARVYPVYLLAFLIALPIAINGVLRGLPAWAGVNLPAASAASLLLVHAWSPGYACLINCPGWSLSAEAFFYATFPLLALLVARVPKRWIVGAAALVWVVSLMAPVAYTMLRPDSGTAPLGPESAGWWLNLVRFNPLVRLPEFVIGMLCGRLYLHDQADGRPPREGALLSGGAALFVAALLAGAAPRLPYVVLHNALLTPAFALLILGLARGGGPLANVLTRRPMVLLGEASYALYLLHVPLLIWMTWAARTRLGNEGRPAIFLALYIAIAITASVLALRLVEEPARRWLRRRLAVGQSRVRSGAAPGDRSAPPALPPV